MPPALWRIWIPVFQQDTELARLKSFDALALAIAKDFN
jgi:hypothetical protein